MPERGNAGTWGSAADVTTENELALWSEDNFGEDLLLNLRNSAIYYWDKSGGCSCKSSKP